MAELLIPNHVILGACKNRKEATTFQRYLLLLSKFLSLLVKLIEVSIAMFCTIYNLFQIFLGGLPSSITETDLRSFFSKYGEVCEVVIMYDQEKKKSRGFGFLSFADESACSKAVSEHFVNIQNKQVK